MGSIAVPQGRRRPKVVHWFRTDLRVHDSPSLAKALELDPETLTCVWTWDPAYVYSHRVGHLRWSFLLESMQVLSDQLTKINKDQRLVVLKGEPTKVWDWVFKEWEGVTHLVYEVDTSAYALQRDKQVLLLAKSLGITVVPVLGHTLYDVPSIIKKNNNAPTTTVAQWGKAAAKLPSPSLPLPVPTSLPPMGPTPLPTLGFLPLTEWKPPLDINSIDLGGDRTSPPTCFLPPLSLTTTIPTPESLSLPPRTASPLVPGGELIALARLEKVLKNKEWIAAFSKPRGEARGEHTKERNDRRKDEATRKVRRVQKKAETGKKRERQ
ncbi:DNA photolyase [Mrakia frigida]|uniref:deoxyribodipyrimidine photo-lyase n=1 Tax=Mrakia frigida TaxID=29902 RepID=UPI003FCC1806